MASRQEDLPMMRTACIVLLFCVTAIAASAQTFTTLHIFDLTDGNQPGGLVQATNGSLYGATVTGGNLSLCFRNGCGTVFSITTGGTFTSLDSFDGSEGQGPYVLPLAQAPGGDLYGTLQDGGPTTGLCLNGFGCGTIYKVTPDGVLTVVYNFCSQNNCADGGQPYTGLIRATDGNFYGTTAYGGSNCVATGGCGTIFKITPTGVLTTLYNFCSQLGCTDGYYPNAGVIQALDGNFYGTTALGGANCKLSNGVCGTIFKITPSGVLTTLYSFCQQSGCPDGGEPGTLIQATSGEFYGATYDGGIANRYCTGGCGTLFKIVAAGALTTLYSFDSTDGSNPSALLQASDGNIYGITDYNGVGGGGTIYKLTPGGTLSTLHSFCFHDICSEPGSYPIGLVQDTNGDFYGATERVFIDGCTDDCGTIYSFSIGLKPFVETQLASGRVGESVTILGTNLSGATGVSFNGTEATIITNSGSAIETTVPAGATSGFITVTGDGSTLKSNKPFQIIP
jgi:uncharacterized repeat protein (TIGR03803 family)